MNLSAQEYANNLAKWKDGIDPESFKRWVDPRRAHMERRWMQQSDDPKTIAHLDGLERTGMRYRCWHLHMKEAFLRGLRGEAEQLRAIMQENIRLRREREAFAERTVAWLAHRHDVATALGNFGFLDSDSESESPSWIFCSTCGLEYQVGHGCGCSRSHGRRRLFRSACSGTRFLEALVAAGAQVSDLDWEAQQTSAFLRAKDRIGFSVLLVDTVTAPA